MTNGNVSASLRNTAEAVDGHTTMAVSKQFLVPPTAPIAAFCREDVRSFDVAYVFCRCRADGKLPDCGIVPPGRGIKASLLTLAPSACGASSSSSRRLRLRTPPRSVFFTGVVYAIGCMVFTDGRFYTPVAEPAFSFRLDCARGFLGGALAWHFQRMWLLAIDGLAYLIYGFISGHFRRDLSIP